jgi:lipid II:glycine glycyltransferase (peptidoglycan interpeptide bridge formation enzyme)
VTGTVTLVNQTEPVAIDQAEWDEAVLSCGGHLLQSWRWGAFKSRFGWDVERIAVSHNGPAALAQVLFRPKAGLSIGYIPRGPVWASNDPDAVGDLWARVDEVARRRKTLTIIVEPDRVLPELCQMNVRLVPGPEPIQPARSVKVDLRDDQSLIDQMHPKTRYNVRLAVRRGVSIRVAEEPDNSIHEFYGMLQDTASRNEFVVHSLDYYREFLRTFVDDACLLFAEIDGKPVAAVIAAVFGEEGIYMYGASSTQQRAHGAAFLLQHETMRWARSRGARRYDLWGIPEYDPTSSANESGDRLAASTGDDRRGLYEFKTRFGGNIVRYPAPLERVYHPVLAALARRLYSPGGQG